MGEEAVELLDVLRGNAEDNVEDAAGVRVGTDADRLDASGRLLGNAGGQVTARAGAGAVVAPAVVAEVSLV